MNKYNLLLFATIIILQSCIVKKLETHEPYMPSRYTKTNHINSSNIAVDTNKNISKIAIASPIPQNRVSKNSVYFSSSNYKLQTAQNYIRTIDRNYFGYSTNNYPEPNKNNLERYYNIENYSKYSKAIFYQADIYEIPKEVKEKAIQIFRPLIDSLYIAMQNKKNIHAEIIILGYTDESEISAESESYKNLLKLTGKTIFNKNEYYNTLSYFRAKQVRDIIQELLSNKKSEFSQATISYIDVIAEGKGIEYPDAKREYEAKGDKRKITKVYWKVYL